MAEDKNEVKKIDAKAAVVGASARVDLHNPTRSLRVIDTGVVSSAQRSLSIHPGETKRNVEVAGWVLKELRSRTKGRGRENADLHVYDAGKAPDPSQTSDEDPDTDDGDAV